MTDLEQRLRHTLHELADTVPESPAPRADLERRLAKPRGIRRPALVAAAAVAVLAGVGVAVPLGMRSDDPPPPAAEREKDEDGLVWSWDYDWLQADGDPLVIATFSRNGAAVDVVVWVRDDQLCVAEGHHVGAGGAEAPAAVTGTSCVAVPSWPMAPAPGTYVVSTPVLSTGAPDSGPVPGLMVFMASPEVEVLEVRRGDGSAVELDRYETLGGVTLYVADFKSSTQGFGYTAYDYAGRVLENAIT